MTHGFSAVSGWALLLVVVTSALAQAWSIARLMLNSNFGRGVALQWLDETLAWSRTAIGHLHVPCA